MSYKDEEECEEVVPEMGVAQCRNEHNRER